MTQISSPQSKRIISDSYLSAVDERFRFLTGIAAEVPKKIIFMNNTLKKFSHLTIDLFIFNLI